MSETFTWQAEIEPCDKDVEALPSCLRTYNRSQADASTAHFTLV